MWYGKLEEEKSEKFGKICKKKYINVKLTACYLVVNDYDDEIIFKDDDFSIASLIYSDD